MAKSIVALIVPMYDPSLKPDNTLPGPQPGIDNTLPGDLPHPEHPIYYPLPPGAPVDPDYGVEINPPRPDQGLPAPQPHPEHPIVLPPGNGGWSPVYIDNTLPGQQPKPDNTLPGQQPIPSHPIVLPPDGVAPPEAGGGKVKWKAIWTPANGWQLVGVVIPTGPVPTPSKKK